MLQEASLQGFVRTILIIVGIYYAFKFLMRLLAPYLMKKMVEKAGANFKQQYEQFQQQQQPNYSYKNNTGNADPSSDKNPRSTKKIGEYIDYEEIE